MATNKITLFDIPSKAPLQTWSYNTWKTRFVLNFKGLDYQTEWLEYPEIKPRLMDHFPNDKDEFTVPTIMMPDDSYVMDSMVISQLLEKNHPEPSLHLDSPYTQRVRDQMVKSQSLRGIYIPLVVKRLLNDCNHEYWHRTRSEWFGMPLDQYEKEHGGEFAFSRSDEYLSNITALLRENEDGPFFMGKTVSYADFYWAGFLLFFERLGDDVFQRLLKGTGDGEIHLKLLEGVKPWSKRNDH
ncbi:thioredoxin-like protein [Xylariaceae sp. FL0016]|nr:thioredoxin-like protein [Xylariaceae sp. FL0016]